MCPDLKDEIVVWIMVDQYDPSSFDNSAETMLTLKYIFTPLFYKALISWVSWKDICIRM